MTTDEIVAGMLRRTWYHKIELAPGVVTPGHDWEALWQPTLERHRQVDFHGLRVLEVGCWDGYWSFETEKLGAAEVWATDDVSQRRPLPPTVPFTIECLGSRVRYRHDVSVYALDAAFDEPFDVVVCYGLLYHLRYPMLGLAQLRRALRTGGRLLLETAVLHDEERPIVQWGQEHLYPGDASTWNAPSLPALRLHLETSYFDVELCEAFLRPPDSHIGRAYARAVAVERNHDPRHVIPDHFLAQYDGAFARRRS